MKRSEGIKWEGQRGEDRQVREGFECARQTATRKGREGKGTFFLSSKFLGFLFRIRFIRYCFLSFIRKILLFLKVTRAAFSPAYIEKKRCDQRQIFCPPIWKLHHMSPLAFIPTKLSLFLFLSFSLFNFSFHFPLSHLQVHRRLCPASL